MQIIRHRYQKNNIGRVERVASVLTGALLFARGIRTRGWVGTGAALLGIAFMRRGVTGFCYTYQALGISSAEARSQSGVRINEAVTINLPREQVYRFWRDLSNLSNVIQRVESVGPVTNTNRSHWILKTNDEKRMEWDSELINEKENELIAWRSIAGSVICNAGSVLFKDAAGERGTEVKVELWYRPAAFDGEDPTDWIRQDLKRLKARLEAGVLPQTDGQPVGAQKSEEEHTHSDVVAKASEESFPASDAPSYIH